MLSKLKTNKKIILCIVVVIGIIGVIVGGYFIYNEKYKEVCIEFMVDGRQYDNQCVTKGEKVEEIAAEVKARNS